MSSLFEFVERSGLVEGSYAKIMPISADLCNNLGDLPIFAKIVMIRRFSDILQRSCRSVTLEKIVPICLSFAKIVLIYRSLQRSFGSVGLHDLQIHKLPNISKSRFEPLLKKFSEE